MGKLITPLMQLEDQHRLSGISSDEEMDFVNYGFGGGLNDPLPDTDAIEFPSLLPEEVIDEFPVPETEIQAIVAVESQLQDLFYLEQDIRRVGGMSQRFAMEAQKILPDFDGKQPAGYYSAEPTATRYKVALEEISKGMWGLIAAGVAALLAIIVKIISWLTGGKKKSDDEPASGSSGGEQSQPAAPQKVEEAVAAAAEMQEKVKEMSKALDIGADAINQADQLLAHADIRLKNEHGKEYQVHSFQDIIDNILTDKERYARAKAFLNTRDGMVHDVINNGEYSQLMGNIAERMSLVNNVMTIKIGVLENVIRKDLGSHSLNQELKNTDSLNKAEKPIEITVNGRTMTLKETADYLKDVRHELGEKNVANPIMFDKLFTTMAHAYSSHAIDRVMHQQSTLVECIAFLNEKLGKMQSVARNLAHDGVPGAMTQGIGQHLREILAVVSSEVIAMGMIAAEVKLYFNTLERLASMALGFGIEVVRKAAAEMRKQKQDIPEGWQNLLDNLSEQHKAITKGYFGNRRR